VSEGRFVLNQFFIGRGPFVLTFVAYDINGRAMCSGASVPMESLGDP
jgi:hypothetical protein